MLINTEDSTCTVSEKLGLQHLKLVFSILLSCMTDFTELLSDIIHCYL